MIENIIYIWVFSVSGNPAQNPDFRILNPETGPENPALCRALGKILRILKFKTKYFSWMIEIKE